MCGENFVRGDERHAHATEVKKALGLILYSLGNASCGFLAQRLGVSRTTTYSWIRQAAAGTAEPTMASEIQAIAVAEIGALYPSKQRTIGMIKAVDRGPGRTMAWVLGRRDAATCQRLYDHVKHLTECLFSTDDGDALAQV